MSYVETMFMIGAHSGLVLGSAFDVNGFNHKDPLLGHINFQRSVLETGREYVRVYPNFPGNREYMNMGASLLKGEEFLDVLPLSKFFSALNAKGPDELAPFFRSLFREGSIQEDWGLDLLEIFHKAGAAFPELQMEALILTSTYKPKIISSSVTRNSHPHSGLGLTCPKDLRKYRTFQMHQVIPEWTSLCSKMRKIY
jgi:hypothetical protein